MCGDTGLSETKHEVEDNNLAYQEEKKKGIYEVGLFEIGRNFCGPFYKRCHFVYFHEVSYCVCFFLLLVELSKFPMSPFLSSEKSSQLFLGH